MVNMFMAFPPGGSSAQLGMGVVSQRGGNSMSEGLALMLLASQGGGLLDDPLMAFALLNPDVSRSVDSAFGSLGASIKGINPKDVITAKLMLDIVDSI